MAVLAIAMFIGISMLAHAYRVIPTESESGVSELGRAIFGGGTFLYYIVQAATTMILVLAANTAFADFPRLASIVSRDGYLPRQFMNQGDRLAFSNGIIVLSVFAAVLIVAFGGDTHALLPLYMIGVFVSFTLSQTGMVIRWRRLKTPGWRTSALINGFGALVTGVVLVIVAITKTLEGAWIVLLLIPIIIAVFKATKTHYDHVGSQLTLRGYTPHAPPAQHRDRAVRRPVARGGGSAAIRRIAVRRCPGDLRGRRLGIDGEAQARMVYVGRARPPRRARLAVPIADGAAARIHRGGRARAARRLRDGDSPGIRPGQVVAASAAQPAGAAHQRRAALQAEHGRH